jgi:hypothetical protein
MTEKSTYRGESIRNALFEEIAWSKVEDLEIVALRIDRHTPEGFVLATPLTQKRAVWLAERGLIPVKACEVERADRLREVTLHPADWAKLIDELREIAAEFPASDELKVRRRRPKKGIVSLTRVYDIPVVNGIPGFKVSWPD